MRDPDGYYIEFANCEKLENFIRAKMAEGEQNWDLSKIKSVLSAGKRLKEAASKSKLSLTTRPLPKDLNNLVGE